MKLVFQNSCIKSRHWNAFMLLFMHIQPFVWINDLILLPGVAFFWNVDWKNEFDNMEVNALKFGNKSLLWLRCKTKGIFWFYFPRVCEKYNPLFMITTNQTLHFACGYLVSRWWFCCTFEINVHRSIKQLNCICI